MDIIQALPARRHVSRLVPKNASVILGLIILTSIVDSVTIGYDGSLMGSLNVMEPYKTYIAPTTALKALNSSITFVGGICSAFFSAWLINKKGRKVGMLVAALVQILGAILQGSAVHMGMFLVGRFFIGAGSGFSGVAAPTYVAETSQPKYRAFALGMYYTCWAVGTLIASGVCYGTQSMTNNWSWRIPSLLQAAFSILCIIILAFIPESPRWLAYENQHEHCLEVLTAVNGLHPDDPIIQVQFREITETIAFEKSEGATLGFKEVVKSAGNRKRLLLAVSVAPLVMLTGSNIITFYFGDMLTGAGITDASTQLQINVILSAWQLVCASCGSLLAEKIGRKWLAGASTALAAIFMYMLGGMTSAYGESDNTSGIYGTVATIFLFLGAYSFGLTPLTVIYPPEILSYSMRATGMGFYTIAAKTSGIFVTWVFPYLFDSIGWKTYIVNASWNILFVLFIIFYWVETKGLTLEEVDEAFDQVKHSDVPNLSAVAHGKVEIVHKV